MFEASVGAGVDGPADLASLFDAFPGLLAFAGEYGAALLTPLPEAPQAYDCHFSVLEAGRGKWCREAGRAVLRAMFEDYDARLLLFRCPKGNLAASAGARMLGAAFYLTTGPGFPTAKGLVPFNVYYLTRTRWLDLTGRRH